MSQENVAAVRRVYAHWARGDFFSTPEIFDPKVQTVWTDLIPDADADVGLEALGGDLDEVPRGVEGSDDDGRRSARSRG